jgi:hypothetical protein
MPGIWRSLASESRLDMDYKRLEATMAKRLTETMAPDFTLTDTQDRSVTLSSFRGDKHVVLVFNRGFM